MARVQVSIGLLAASLALLLVYGADVAAGSSSPDRKGFLPLDEAARGSGLGGGAVAMSIAGFVVSWKRHAPAVFILLFVNGGLIIAGMLALVAQGALASENSEGAMRTIGSTIGLGALLVGLGGWKVAGDRRTPGPQEQAPR